LSKYTRLPAPGLNPLFVSISGVIFPSCISLMYYSTRYLLICSCFSSSVIFVLFSPNALFPAPIPYAFFSNFLIFSYYTE
jgi:hypothetical protein